jgi:hypothetical protein
VKRREVGDPSKLLKGQLFGEVVFDVVNDGVDSLYVERPL